MKKEFLHTLPADLKKALAAAPANAGTNPLGAKAMARRNGWMNSAARLVEQALRQIHAQRHALNNYDFLLRKLHRLDAPLGNLKENIPALYERHLQRGEASSSGRKPRTRRRA